MKRSKRDTDVRLCRQRDELGSVIRTRRRSVSDEQVTTTTNAACWHTARADVSVLCWRCGCFVCLNDLMDVVFVMCWSSGCSLRCNLLQH